MAKILAYDEEARQKLASGVTKLARAVRCTLGPRGRNAVIDKGWGSPTVTKDGVTVAEEIELTDPYENMGAQLVKEAASQDLRLRRRRHDHRHRPGRGDLQGRPQGPGRRRRPDGPEARDRQGRRGRRRARQGPVEEGLGQEGDHRGRLDRRQQRPVDRREAGRRLREGRHRRRDHRRGGQGLRDDRRRRRGHAVRPRLPEPPLRHRPGPDGGRPRGHLHPDLRGEDQLARPS